MHLEDGTDTDDSSNGFLLEETNGDNIDLEGATGINTLTSCINNQKDLRCQQSLRKNSDDTTQETFLSLSLKHQQMFITYF